MKHYTWQHNWQSGTVQYIRQPTLGDGTERYIRLSQHSGMVYMMVQPIQPTLGDGTWRYILHSQHSGRYMMVHLIQPTLGDGTWRYIQDSQQSGTVYMTRATWCFTASVASLLSFLFEETCMRTSHVHPKLLLTLHTSTHTHTCTNHHMNTKAPNKKQL